MDVIISLDSEDAFTPAAIDAELWWAEALSRHGVRGSFQLVGALARKMLAEGRQDVIAAIGRHEIGFHTDHHSRPPIHPVIAAGAPLGETVDLLVERERPGVQSLLEAWGRQPVSFVAPGDSWTPATTLAMRRLGMQVVGNCQQSRQASQPWWFCGMLHCRYDISFDSFFDRPGDLAARFLAAFDQHVQALAGQDDALTVVYSHPCRLVTSAFWDAPFYRGNDPGPIVPPAPMRSATEIEVLKRGLDEALAGLLRKPGVRVIDFQTVLEERGASRPHSLAHLKPDDLLRGDGAGDQAFNPIAIDSFRYNWSLMPPDFDETPIRKQLRGLAWTNAPAPRQHAR